MKKTDQTTTTAVKTNVNKTYSQAVNCIIRTSMLEAHSSCAYNGCGCCCTYGYCYCFLFASARFQRPSKKLLAIFFFCFALQTKNRFTKHRYYDRAAALGRPNDVCAKLRLFKCGQNKNTKRNNNNNNNKMATNCNNSTVNDKNSSNYAHTLLHSWRGLQTQLTHTRTCTQRKWCVRLAS